MAIYISMEIPQHATGRGYVWWDKSPCDVNSTAFFSAGMVYYTICKTPPMLSCSARLSLELFFIVQTFSKRQIRGLLNIHARPSLDLPQASPSTFPLVPPLSCVATVGQAPHHHRRGSGLRPLPRMGDGLLESLKVVVDGIGRRLDGFRAVHALS